MLYFCKWKDEDGTHYGVCRKVPKAYFNWKGCHLCNPMYALVYPDQAKKWFKVLYTLSPVMVSVDIIDWDAYFERIRPNLRYVYNS